MTGPPAQHEEEIDNIRNIQKDFIENQEPQKVADEIDLRGVEEMSMNELKEVIKEAAMEEVELDKSEKLVTPPKPATVSPAIENAIDKVRHIRQYLQFICAFKCKIDSIVNR